MLSNQFLKIYFQEWAILSLDVGVGGGKERKWRTRCLSLSREPEEV